MGPVDNKDRPISPISFDSIYRKLSLSKPRRMEQKSQKKENRSIQDLGLKIDNTPSYSTAIALRNNRCSSQGPDVVKNLEEEEDSISNGTFLPRTSLTDFEVMRCNNRILNSSKSKVGWRI